MNGLTDLEACLDFLVRQKLTSPGRISLQAHSAGGILAGAMLNKKPQASLNHVMCPACKESQWYLHESHAALCIIPALPLPPSPKTVSQNADRADLAQVLAAVILQAPFVDVLAAMTDPLQPLTVHEYDEWGNPHTAEGLRSVRQACPYTNIQPASYPPVLVVCSCNDVRVPIWNPAKWVARLRDHNNGEAPILLAPNDAGGHFGAEQEELSTMALLLSFIIGIKNRPR